jgi:hypothetical protein
MATRRRRARGGSGCWRGDGVAVAEGVAAGGGLGPRDRAARPRGRGRSSRREAVGRLDGAGAALRSRRRTAVAVVVAFVADLLGVGVDLGTSSLQSPLLSTMPSGGSQARVGTGSALRSRRCPRLRRGTSTRGGCPSGQAGSPVLGSPVVVLVVAIGRRCSCRRGSRAREEHTSAASCVIAASAVRDHGAGPWRARVAQARAGRIRQRGQGARVADLALEREHVLVGGVLLAQGGGEAQQVLEVGAAGAVAAGDLGGDRGSGAGPR